MAGLEFSFRVSKLQTGKEFEGTLPQCIDISTGFDYGSSLATQDTTAADGLEHH